MDMSHSSGNTAMNIMWILMGLMISFEIVMGWMMWRLHKRIDELETKK